MRMVHMGLDEHGLAVDAGESREVRTGVSSSEKSLRVVMQTPSWPLGHVPNGIVTYVHHLRNELTNLGARVRIVTGRLGEGDWPDVVRIRRVRDTGSAVERGIYRLRRGLFGDAEKWRVSAKLLSEAIREIEAGDGVDVLECSETFGVPMWMDPSIRVPVVVRVHGPWFLVGRLLGVPDDREFRNRVHAEGKCLEKARWVTCPSRDVLERTRDHYGIALENACVIGNPGAVSGSDQVWSQESADPDTVLFVGRFDNVKGGDLVLEAFEKLAQRRPNVRLWFVGPDSGLEDSTGKIHIADYMKQHLSPGVADRVKLFGTQTPEQIKALRKRAAVTVVASRYEVYPMTVVEAMSCGSPVVATAVGGIPELIVDGESGYLVPESDTVAMADRLNTLLEDRGLASRFGKRGNEESMTRLHPHSIAEQTLENYRRVVEG